MKKNLSFLLFSFCLSASLQAQTPSLVWVAQNKAGTIYSYSEGNGVSVGADGKVYACGSYKGTIDLNPGTGVQTSTTSSIYNNDGYVQKLDASGSLVWAKVFRCGTPYYSSNSCTSIGTDALGNVYIAGSFTNSASLAPYPYNSSGTSKGSSDVYVTKLDASGNFLWSYAFGSTGTDYIIDMAVDADGSVYLTGPVNGTIDFDPSSVEHSITGVNDIYALKISSSGYFEWLSSVVDSGDGYTYGISLDNANHVVIGGSFGGTVDFDPSPTQTYTETSTGGTPGFILVMDKNTMAFSWVYTILGTAKVLGVTADSTGNIYATGIFENEIDFNSSSGVYNMEPESRYSDIFLLKLNPAGNFCWAKSMGGDLDEFISGIVYDEYDQGISIAGSQRSPMDCDPGPAEANTIFYGSNDLYLIKLDTTGAYKWSTSIGGSSDDFLNDFTVYQSQIIATGHFQSTVDFDPSPGTNILSADNVTNAFVVNVNYSLVTGISTASSSTSVSAYPNPGNGTITINTKEEMHDAFMKLINLSGEIILQEEQLNGYNYVIDVSSQRNGIYILELYNGYTVSKIKLVKVQ